jgi:histidyl-tRNA synthetase
MKIMEKISSNPVRGTRDILPEEMRIRDELEHTIAGIYKAHGFSRIETPALENIDLLLGSDGGDNLKMLFTVLKRGRKFKPAENSTPHDLCDMGLRYDLTLPLSRQPRRRTGNALQGDSDRQRLPGGTPPAGPLPLL